MEYNAAFFGYVERMFKLVKEEFGEEKALELTATCLEQGLGSAYDSMGFEKGKPEDFARVTGERDKSVGLYVEFPEVTDTRIVYQFHDDPFPNLKGFVEAEKLDATYMKFKVSYLLGEGWSYRTTKHLWKGDECTEHVIEKMV